MISGFLITGHLLREAERTGRVRVVEFWARRVRRLLPAALLVLAVSAILTLTVMPSISRTQNLGDIGFAAGYIVNWHLAADAVDYLNAANPPSLAQHYWSLSVEEQFYLVMPILIAVAASLALIAAKRGGPRLRTIVLALLLVVFVASLAYSILETARSQQTAYFFTTTRAWEFVLGGLISLIPASRWAPGMKLVGSWIALIVIVGSAIAFDAATAFPGWIALLPVGATAALIWLGDRSPGEAAFAGSPQRFMHLRPVQFIGDTSYAIYLWHWPLIVAVPSLLGDSTGAMAQWRLAAIVLPITIVLAWLTQRFVEEPIRRAPGVLRTRWATFGGMAVAMLAIIGLVVGQTAAINADVDHRRAQIQALIEGEPLGDAGAGSSSCVGASALLDDCANPHEFTAAIDPAFAEQDRPWFWFDSGIGAEHCTSTTVGSWKERSCDFPASNGASHAPSVVMIGDSHAEHIFAPLQRVAAANDWSLRLESRASCGLFTEPSAADDENAARCAEWGAALRSDIASDPTVDTVLVSLRTNLYDLGDAARVGLQQLIDAGKQVIVIRDVPSVGARDANGDAFTGPGCVLAIPAADDVCAWIDPQFADWLVADANELNVPVIDTYAVTCPDGTCHMITGDLIMYTDNNHLTGMYSLSLARWFDSQLTPLIEPPTA